MVVFITALSSFYVAIGRLNFVVLTVVIANAINVLLNFILILGIKGIVPALGITGNAIAIVIALFVQASMLLYSFTTPQTHQAFNTRTLTFDKRMLIKCLKIGMPNSIGIILDVLGFSVILLILSHIQPHYLSVHSIVSTIFILFTFLIDGLSKGTTAVAANIIGTGKFELMHKLLKSIFKLYIIIIALLFVPLIIYPELLSHTFLTNSAEYNLFKHEAAASLKFVWLFFLVDGIFWTYSGILTAAGDTKFLMALNIISVWVGAIIPIYIGLKYFNIKPTTVWAIIALYKILPSALLIYRYKQGVWKKVMI